MHAEQRISDEFVFISIQLSRVDLTHWPLGNFHEILGYLSFQTISVIDGWVISCELALRWMSLDLTDDKSTLVQVMAWCRQATSHYLSQCWPSSMSPYGVTRPQWVNNINPINAWVTASPLPHITLTAYTHTLHNGALTQRITNHWRQNSHGIRGTGIKLQPQM